MVAELGGRPAHPVLRQPPTRPACPSVRELPPRLRRLRARPGLPADRARRSSRRSPTRRRPRTVSALQSALRARYAEADWLTVVRPINDAARIQQRDALVAYILQQLGDGYAQSPVSLTTTAAAAAGATDLSCAGVDRRRCGHARPGGQRRPGHGGDARSPGPPSRSARASWLACRPARPCWPRRPAPAFDTADSLYEYFLIDTQTQPRGADVADPARAVRGPAVHRAGPPQPRAAGQPGRHRRGRSGSG